MSADKASHHILIWFCLSLVAAAASNSSCTQKRGAVPNSVYYPDEPIRGRAWVNSLGMTFQYLPDRPVLFGIHEVRVRDFQHFVQEAAIRWNLDPSMSQGATRDPVPLPRDIDHPAVNITWHQAVAFCTWLTDAEGGKWIYRLPTLDEWLVASGPGSGRCYWGDTWPPADRTGNFSDRSSLRLFSQPWDVIAGYYDGFPYLAPVMSFHPNSLGFFDLDGNVSEWLNDRYPDDKSKRSGHARIGGGSWFSSTDEHFMPGAELSDIPESARSTRGFRCAVEFATFDP